MAGARFENKSHSGFFCEVSVTAALYYTNEAKRSQKVLSDIKGEEMVYKTRFSKMACQATLTFNGVKLVLLLGKIWFKLGLVGIRFIVKRKIS